MEAILKFSLPEDQPEFNTALQGSDWKHVCWEMDQYLRKELKYSDDKSFEELKLLQEVREELNRFMIENNVNFDEVE